MKYILLFHLFIVNLFANNYGSLLYNGNCVACHFKTKSIASPSMSQIRQRYKNAFPKKADFISYMSIWVQHPNPETSIMQDAILKYKIMPELGFDLETVKHISKYIYETNFTLNSSN